MELAKQLSSSHFLILAVNSLRKAQVISVVPIPIVSIILAQAEGSLGLKENWESDLRFEWFSWPPGLSLELGLSALFIYFLKSKMIISVYILGAIIIYIVWAELIIYGKYSAKEYLLLL